MTGAETIPPGYGYKIKNTEISLIFFVIYLYTAIFSDTINSNNMPTEKIEG